MTKFLWRKGWKTNWFFDIYISKILKTIPRVCASRATPAPVAPPPTTSTSNSSLFSAYKIKIAK